MKKIPEKQKKLNQQTLVFLNVLKVEAVIENKKTSYKLEKVGMAYYKKVYNKIKIYVSEVATAITNERGVIQYRLSIPLEGFKLAADRDITIYALHCYHDSKENKRKILRTQAGYGLVNEKGNESFLNIFLNALPAPIMTKKKEFKYFFEFSTVKVDQSK